jgi:hypothetical protein
MKHRTRPPEQDDLLRPRLIEMIDLRHELVKLTTLIDWEVFEREWAGFFPSTTGRPATSPRLVAGLLYLQHAFRLSDEAIVARWVENPYYQHFTGETFFQHRLPIDPSSLTRWRKRIGEEGVEWLLTQTFVAGRKSGATDESSVKRVAVDTTVMEKTIAYPTDARHYERARAQLVTHHLQVLGPPDIFSPDIEFGVREGGTVTHVALQIAYYMGFAEVILIGMDHRYEFTGKPHERRRFDGTDVNHFSPDYFSGHDWQNPDLVQSEESYAAARTAFEAAGRQIIDATVDGACPVFRKGDLRQVLWRGGA